MIVTFLDLAGTTGWAHGDSAGAPTIGHWDVRSPHASLVAGNLAYKLRCLFRDFGVPEFFAIEKTLDPAAQPNRFTVRSQEELRGAALGVAGMYRIPKVLEVPPADVRRHLMGQAHAGQRDLTKAMVMRHVKMIGYPVKTEDEADAAAGWEFVVHGILRVAEKQLRMYQP